MILINFDNNYISYESTNPNNYWKVTSSKKYLLEKNVKIYFNEINSLEEECFICFHKKKLNIFCMICKTNPFCTNCYNNLQTKVCPLCRKPL